MSDWHYIPRAFGRCAVLFMAQVFGRYRVTINDFERRYHVYQWRGRDYHIDGETTP